MHFRSSDTLIITTLCLALFTDTFVYAIVVPILPSLLLDRGVGPEYIQTWTSILLASYGGALLVGPPLVSLCQKHASRKLPLILGFLCITLAMVLFMLAHHPLFLLLARISQGLSGAVVGVLGLTCIAETASQDDLGLYMALGSMALTFGMISGPVIGGLLFDQLGNLAVFGAPIVLLLLDIVLLFLIVEKRDRDGKGRVSSASSIDEESPLLEEEQTRLGLSQYLHPVLLAAVFSVIAASCVLSAFESTLPIHVIETYNWSTIGAGLIFLPLSVPSLFTSPVGVYLIPRGPKLIIATSFLVGSGPIIALRWIDETNRYHDGLLVLILSVIGMCMMVVQALTMVEVSTAVWKIETAHGLQMSSGYGYVVSNLAFAGGQFIGPMLGLSRLGGWGVMTLTLGGVCIVAGFLLFLTYCLYDDDYDDYDDYDIEDTEEEV